jgi:hypothetical protein
MVHLYNKAWYTNNIYSQTCLKGYIYTTNRGKPTIYTVKPDLKGTSIQQIVVNQPYIQSNCLKGCIYTTNHGKPTIYTVKPVLKGTSIQSLTLYLVGLPLFVV